MTPTDPKPSKPEDEGLVAGLAEVKEIFLAASAMGLAERHEYVARRCGGNEELRELVQSMLEGIEKPLVYETLADDIMSARSRAEAGLSKGEGGALGPLAHGSRIGPYHLLERIGEGGFGVVFMAEQERPVKRRVALKIIKLGMDTKQVVARFEAERQALAMMEHPGIAKVFDAGVTETGRPYFVMELVRGLPITEYCDRKRLSIERRLELFSEVCDAIQHAHQKGVIHRDIKPTNVLVTEIGERTLPKVIDFGIAKATTARLTEKTIFTEFRQMIGTPEYMSPEQAEMTGTEVDTRTDVYSLGVLLYELLTGQTPFDSKRLRSAAYGEMQRIIRDEDPLRPSTRLTDPLSRTTVAGTRGIEADRLQSKLRGELDWVVMRCLEKDPGRRYDSAGSLMRELGRYLGGEAVEAVPPSRAYLALKFARRNRGAVVAALLLLAAVLVGLAGTSLGYLNAQRQRDAAERQRDLARQAEQRATDSEAVAIRNSYSATMLSASAAMSDQPGDAGAFLDAAPESLRGWEHAVIRSRLDTSVRHFDAPLATEPSDDFLMSRMIAHPDGKSVFSIRSMDDIAVQQLDLETGDLLATYPKVATGPIGRFSRTEAILSEDGSTLYVYGSELSHEEYLVAVWDTKTRSLLRTHRLPASDSKNWWGVDWHNNSVVNAESDHFVWRSLEDGTERKLYPRLEDFCENVRFDHDGRVMALLFEHGPMELYTADDHRFLGELVGHKNAVDSVAFSADDRWLATGSLDRTARVWDLRADPPTSIVLEHPADVNRVCFSPDGSLLATESDMVRVWDRATGELLGTFTSQNPLRGTLFFMPDNHTVGLREQGGGFRFWDVHAERTVKLRGHQGFMSDAKFASGTGLIVSTGWDGWYANTPGCLRIWDSQTGLEVARFGEPGQVCAFLETSPDGTIALASITHGPDQRGLLIDLRTGRVIDLPGKAVYAFHPSGKVFAAMYADRLEIRDAADGSLLRSIADGFSTYIRNELSWSPSGERLTHAYGTDLTKSGFLRTVRVIDTETWETLAELEGKSASFSPDGSKIYVITNSTGVVATFDNTTLTEINRATLPGFDVQYLSVRPTGDRIAARTNQTGHLNVWETEHFDRVTQFFEPGFVSAVDWDDSGERLLTVFEDTICLWDDTPLSKRVAQRTALQAAQQGIRSVVEELFAEFQTVEAVLGQVDQESAWPAAKVRAARLEVLRRGIERASQSAADQREAPTETRSQG